MTLAQHEIVQSESVVVATQNQTLAPVKMKPYRNGSQDSPEARLHDRFKKISGLAVMD